MDTENVMAKREQKGNREAKKPKKEKVKTIAAAPSQKGTAAGWQHDVRIRQKEIEITARFGGPFSSVSHCG